MKRFIALAVAAAAGAFVLFRPLPPPAAPSGWATGSPRSDLPPLAAPASGATGEHGRAKHGRRARRGAADPPAPGAVGPALVYVAGEVARPGVYRVGADARARDALVLAGGARPGADLVAVNLAAHLSDGDEIVVPKIGEEPPPSARARRRPGASPGHRSSGRRHRKHRASADGVPPSGMVDLNAADAATLATVPGIGPGIAERIVAFRTANGPFASVDELLDVSGITDRRLDAILPYVVAR